MGVVSSSGEKLKNYQTLEGIEAVHLHRPVEAQELLQKGRWLTRIFPNSEKNYLIVWLCS